MSLRIHNHSQLVDPSSSLNGNTAQPSSGASSSASSAQNPIQDTTLISNLSSQLASGFAIRQDKVDALRVQVNNGTYGVEPQAIAAAMQNSHLL